MEIAFGAAIVVAIGFPWLAIVLQVITGTQAASGALPLLFAPALALAAFAATEQER